MSGSIYKLTCKTTGLSYIGQTQDYKIINGKKITYGVNEIFKHHVSSAKHKKTPLAEAIKTYGKDDFLTEVIEHVELERLDEREVHWISTLKTVTPCGYNVYRHGKSKFHESSTLENYFKDIAVSCTISPIKENGKYKKVYLKIKLTDGSVRRLAFCPKVSTIEENYNNAKLFCKDFTCPIIEENYTSTEIDEKYKTKLKDYIENPATKIRITTAAKLIAVYINSDEKMEYKKQKKICFGGVTVTLNNAYKTALSFVSLLNKTESCIIEDVISQQQATALKGETSPLE
jgi:hypothetical protein